MQRISKNSDYEFIFEYEDSKDIPNLKEGDTFKYFGKTYRIDFVSEGFTEKQYSSFLVIASPE